MSDEPRAVDPVTGIAIRFIRQWQEAAPGSARERVEMQASADLLRRVMAARAWKLRQTPAGLKVLKALQISPE